MEVVIPHRRLDSRGQDRTSPDEQGWGCSIPIYYGWPLQERKDLREQGCWCSGPLFYGWPLYGWTGPRRQTRNADNNLNRLLKTPNTNKWGWWGCCYQNYFAVGHTPRLQSAWLKNFDLLFCEGRRSTLEVLCIELESKGKRSVFIKGRRRL